MAVTVEKVITRKQIHEFIKFPYTLYKKDKNWVPQLLMDDYKKINRKKHPFYQHAEAEFFLARKDGVVAGRIAAIHDAVWEQTHKEKAAYWGWFECVDDHAVAQQLFDAALGWARGTPSALGRSHGYAFSAFRLCASRVFPLSLR